MTERKDTLELILYEKRDKRLITLPKRERERERGEKKHCSKWPYSNASIRIIEDKKV